MRIVQINLQNSRLANAELSNFMARRGIDVALVQEPYTCLNQHGKRVLPSIARSSRVAMSSVDDETGRVNSAIVVVGSDINCMCLSHLSDNYFSVMVIDRYSSGEVQSSATTAGLGSTGSGDDTSSSATPAGQGSTRSSDSTRPMRKPLVLVSGYFKFNKPIEPMIERLSEIMRVLGGFEVIFGGDINARSELWHDARARDCPKGLAFENFLAETRLVLLNLPGWPSTYCNTLGESNIDVTLVNSRSLHQRVRGWHVETGLITSDHRVIGFEIVGWGPFVPDAPRFITKDVDWGRFRATLARHLNDTPLTRYDDPLRDIDSRVRGLTKAYQQSCGEVLKASRPVKFRGTVWWNQRLEDEKKRVNRARRRLQRARDPVAREVLLARWRKLRDQYGKNVDAARKKSWNVQVSTGLGKDHWGFVYKLAYNKLKGKTLLHSVQTDAGDYTLTVEEAVGQYLHTLIPGNEADGPAIVNRLDEIVREARLEQENGTQRDEAGEVDRGDVLMAIEVMNKDKAPGADRIPGIAIKKTMDQVAGILSELTNSCLEAGYFPSDWKVGLLKHIIKGPERDPAQIKSYRPLTLLGEFSKILERIIRAKIRAELGEENPFHEHQYGYTRGKGTVDAMHRLKTLIDGSEAKHKMGIFLDMAGAFDNVQWPNLLEALKRRGLSAKLLKMLSSYFTGRLVVMTAEGGTARKVPTQGCPQGSILGPDCWNYVMDELLNQAYPNGCEIQAYADDVAILVTGRSRTEIERKANEAMETVQVWLTRNRIQLSIDKCCYVLFGNSLSRDPTVGFSGGRIHRTRSTKYLGIWWDEKLTFETHVEKTCQSARKGFWALRRHVELNWGDPPQSMRLIYEGATLPKVLYGIGVWGDALSRVKVRRRLLTLQRHCGIGIAGCKFSVSHPVTQLLASEPPLDLVAQERVVIERLKKGWIQTGNKVSHIERDGGGTRLYNNWGEQG
ncbi:hypothetical protein M8J76_002984 [Diaphorina citri]|nr:hypothetical protein M8J76_002984 [Diaphorina citri]